MVRRHVRADLIFDPAQNPLADKLGMAYAPINVKSPSGWLWAWAFALESGSKNKEAALQVHGVGDQQGLSADRS